MTLPTFLIIGAMKSGTTTLFHDLRKNQFIYIPDDKELNHLNSDAVLAPNGREKYESFFEKAGSNQCCGEASTSYTKLPNYAGVPLRAHETLGSNLKLIYLVRNPIGRLISHYHHVLSAGVIDLQIDDAIHQYPDLINFSKYAMQLEPWINQFGKDQLKIITFESFIQNRSNTLKSICKFLHVQQHAEQIQENIIYNKGEGKPVNHGVYKKFTKTWFYRSHIRPRLSLSLRNSFKRALFSKASSKSKPSADSINWAIEQLKSDMECFSSHMGGNLPWDFSSAVDLFGEK